MARGPAGSRWRSRAGVSTFSVGRWVVLRSAPHISHVRYFQQISVGAWEGSVGREGLGVTRGDLAQLRPAPSLVTGVLGGLPPDRSQAPTPGGSLGLREAFEAVRAARECIPEVGGEALVIVKSWMERSLAEARALNIHLEENAGQKAREAVETEQRSARALSEERRRGRSEGFERRLMSRGFSDVLPPQGSPVAFAPSSGPAVVSGQAVDGRLASAAESGARRLAAPAASQTASGQRLACLCCNQSLSGCMLSCAAGCGGDVQAECLPHSGWSSVGTGYVCPVCAEASPAAAFRVTSARLAQSIPLLASSGDFAQPAHLLHARRYNSTYNHPKIEAS